MAGFFKSFGKGILYVLFLPFILLILAVYAVFGLIILIILFFKNVILFFKGKSIYSGLDEDIKAKAILDASKNAAQQMIQNQLNPIKQNTTTNTTTNNIFIVNPNDLNSLTSAQQLIQKASAIDNEIVEPPLIENNDVKLISDNSTIDEDGVETISLSRHEHTPKEPPKDEIKIEEKIEEVKEIKPIESPSSFYEPKQGRFIQDDDYIDNEEEDTSGVSISSFKTNDKGGKK